MSIDKVKVDRAIALIKKGLAKCSTTFSNS